MIIYKTTNRINGKIYIGQDTKNNPKYLGSGTSLKEAFKKYGKENFVKEVLDICTDKESLDQREKYWIETLNSRNPSIGYNIAIGGEGQNLEIGKELLSKIHKGKKLSEETKEKIRKTKQSKPVSQASIDALLKHKGHRKGKKMSETAKQLISSKNKGKTAWNKNKTMSEETRQKMSEAKKGKTVSLETKRKMSEAARNRKASTLSNN